MKRGIPRFISNISNQILDFIFPRICVACEKQHTNTESAICVECLWNLPRTNVHLQEEEKLESKFWGKLKVVDVYAFLKFSKRGKVQKIIHAIKYKNQTELATFLGRLYASELISNENIKKIDLLIPVPLHKKRQRDRGYNQAEKFSQGLTEILDIPTITDLVIRKKETISQTKTSNRFERYKNIKDAFHIIDNEVVNNKSVALIDDVLTSGSTLESLGQTLLNAGAKEIFIITLATAEYA